MRVCVPSNHTDVKQGSPHQCKSSFAHFPTCTLVSLVGSTICSQLLAILISSVKKSVCNLDMSSFIRYMVEDDCPVFTKMPEHACGPLDRGRICTG